MYVDTLALVGSIYLSFFSCHLLPLAQGMQFRVCFALLCDDATKENHLREADELQIRGLPGLLGFSGALKGYVKSELPEVFLAAVGEYCEGEMPDYVWWIGKTRADKDSLVSLRQRVAAAARELSEEQERKALRKSLKGDMS